MDYLKNHYWCSSSHWDNTHYDCSILVSLSSYKEGYKEDWENLTYVTSVFSQNSLTEYLESLEKLHKKYPDRKFSSDGYTGHVNIRKFKPEVLQWLTDNVPDYQGNKGWCVGSEEYTISDSCSSLTIFMQRRSDAMKFIKTWSKWKKPIYYTQYFTDVHKKLDLTTLKYVIR